jgi:hypothetical protein
MIRQQPTVRIHGRKASVRLATAKPKVRIKGQRPKVRIKGNWRDDFPTRRSSPGESSD